MEAGRGAGCGRQHTGPRDASRALARRPLARVRCRRARAQRGPLPRAGGWRRAGRGDLDRFAQQRVRRAGAGVRTRRALLRVESTGRRGGLRPVLGGLGRRVVRPGAALAWRREHRGRRARPGGPRRGRRAVGRRDALLRVQPRGRRARRLRPVRSVVRPRGRARGDGAAGRAQLAGRGPRAGPDRRRQHAVLRIGPRAPGRLRPVQELPRARQLVAAAPPRGPEHDRDRARPRALGGRLRAVLRARPVPGRAPGPVPGRVDRAVPPPGTTPGLDGPGAARRAAPARAAGLDGEALGTARHHLQVLPRVRAGALAADVADARGAPRGRGVPARAGPGCDVQGARAAQRLRDLRPARARWRGGVRARRERTSPDARAPGRGRAGAGASDAGSRVARAHGLRARAGADARRAARPTRGGLGRAARPAARRC